MTELIKPLKTIFPLKYLNEPLLGFALVGGLIFMLYNPSDEVSTTQIDITEVTISSITSNREQLLGRNLVNFEREELIQQFINNEILVREGINKGLYLQDPKIRKRLAEKMYFLIDQEIPEPSEKELKAYFKDHPTDFLSPKTLSFEHLFFKTHTKEIDTILTNLNNDIDVDKNLGDIFWLGRIMEYQTPDQIISVLGVDFYKSISKLPEKQWSATIKSARGWHLVRIIAYHEPQLFPPEILNEKLISRWKEDQKEQLRSAYLSKLREQYEIKMPVIKKKG